MTEPVRLKPRPLEWLSNVDGTGRSDRVPLVWDATAERWKPGSADFGGFGSNAFAYDHFVAASSPATAYRLTYIPVSNSCLLAINGLVQIEGTDYTCDYGTGVVTVAASLSSGDDLVARYATAGGALSTLTPVVVDDFNGPDALLAGRTTSDGNAVWTVHAGPWGTVSNQAALTSFAGGDLFATVDAGVANGAVQLTLPTVDTGISASSGLIFRFVDTSNYFFIAVGSGLGSTHYQIWRVLAGAATLRQTGAALAADGDVLLVDPTGVGGGIELFVNGVSDATVSDSNLTSATEAGLYGSGTTVTRWEDFKVLI